MNPPNEENDPQNPGEIPEGEQQQPVDPAQYPQQGAEPAQFPQEPAPVDPAQYPQQPPAEEANYEAYQELAPQPPAIDPALQQVPVDQAPPAVDPEPATVNRPARRRVPASGRRGAPRTKPARPGAPAGRPGYRGRPTRGRAPVNVEGGGFMTVLLALIAVAFLGAAIMVVLPKDMSGIKGYPVSAGLNTSNPKNLLTEAQSIMFEPGGKVELSEEEVNLYLNHRIDGIQGGALGGLLKYKGTYVDFSKGVAEIYVERSLFGMPVTMSSRIRIEHYRSEVRWEAAGGTLGKINLGSSHLQPVMQVFIRMMRTCRDEVGVINHMANIHFEEDKIILETTL